VAYAQLLNDASEVKFSEEKDSAEAGDSGGGKMAAKNLRLELPVLQPKVTVPVIELFLK
jgi:alpha-L-fucosidase